MDRAKDSKRTIPEERCRITFGVQGGVHRHSPLSRDTGPYILLEGSCWSELRMEEVTLPVDWFPDEHCPRNMRRVLAYDGSEEDMIDDSSISSTTATETVNGEVNASNKCVIRPLYTLESSDIRLRSSGEDDIGFAVQYSAKYRNNAYVDIIGALFKNDKSYFTTTEVMLLSHDSI